MNMRALRTSTLWGLGFLAVSTIPVQDTVVSSSNHEDNAVPYLQILARSAYAQGSSEEVTPSHVYQSVLELASEIDILREAMGVTDYPLESEFEDDRSPIHVFAKTVEVRHKISAAQRRLGMAASQVEQIPLKVIVPKDVHGSVERALAEVRRVKDQLVIEDQIDPPSFQGGKTPSMVYQLVGDVSFMLDGLVGRPVDMNDVFRNMVYLQGDLELVATKLRVALELDAPIVDERNRLKDVAQQVMRGTFKVINLQTRIGMDASGVPEISLVRITPAELVTALTILQAELVRIKVHLGIQLPREERVVARNKRPKDAFAQALLIIRNLDLLARAAGNYTG